MDRNEIVNLMQNRFACRMFDNSKKISEEDFNAILDVARLSPTSTASEPFEILVVKNQELKDKIKEFVWGGKNQIENGSHFIIMLTKDETLTRHNTKDFEYHAKKVLELTDEQFETRRSKLEEFEKNFDLSDNRKMTDWAHRQTYIALSNMLTLSKAIGIDSCPIEGYLKSKCREILKEYVNLEGFDISVMAVFGYVSPENKPRPKRRRNIEDVVRYI